MSKDLFEPFDNSTLRDSQYNLCRLVQASEDYNGGCVGVSCENCNMHIDNITQFEQWLRIPLSSEDK